MTHRNPVEKSKVTGADIKNPQRHRKRKSAKGLGPIGEPYPLMTDEQKEKWRELADNLPWLNASHRILLRLACRLAVELDGDEFGVSKAQALSSVLSKLGATPVDESRVEHSDEDNDDDELFD